MKSIFKLIIFIFFLQTIICQESGLDKHFEKLVGLQKEIIEINKLFENYYPVAIAEVDELFIYDFNSLKGQYEFIKKVKPPFPLPKGIRASFPLESYSKKPSCVVSSEIFDTIEGYVTIFHEFVHCHQANTVENEIKVTLEVNKEAMKNKHYSWELDYDFPYLNSEFIRPYNKFLKALINNDRQAILSNRIKLKKQLNKKEYEYLVWQEFKEGFARHIENKIRKKFNLKLNDFGKAKPYGRIVFYYGGDKYIEYLVKQDPDLMNDLEKLFQILYGE